MDLLLLLSFFCAVYFEIEYKRLEIYVAEICPSQQVGSEFFLDGTRVSKTRDANLQTSFLPMPTYYILSFYCTSLQISPNFAT